jgi:glutamyl-Q tRNA(Asp) synthetase
MITRFAPSPTGDLHLGHALAAWIAFDLAKRNGGEMLLRFEDIDVTRVRPEFYDAIEEDLSWLGITWSGVPWRQLDRTDAYQAALEKLQILGVLYPCFCTRKEIAMMTSAPQRDDGLEGVLYPGICRNLTESEKQQRIKRGDRWSWRLDAEKAAQLCGPLSWYDHRFGEYMLDTQLLGDVVIARKDIGVSYHLAVVVDDAAQNVTWVTRGEDLLSSTHVHVMLQKLLVVPQPRYWHHSLVCDEQGKRLAKRHDALSLRAMRKGGVSPIEVIERITTFL